MPLFWTDSIVMSYSDVNAAMQWWITAFDCKQVSVPEDRDEPLPSDVALKLSGDDFPRVLLSSRSEGREPSGHPIIFTGKVKRAYEHVRSRGVMGGAIHEDGEPSCSKSAIQKAMSSKFARSRRQLPWWRRPLDEKKLGIFGTRAGVTLLGGIIILLIENPWAILVLLALAGVGLLFAFSMRRSTKNEPPSILGTRHE